MSISQPAEVLARRISWTAAVLARVIDRGRADGWVEGATRPEVPAVARPVELESTADRLRDRLALSPPQHDAVWLLACVEIDPRLTQLAQVLAADVNVQMLQACLAAAGQRELGIDELEQLAALGLVETATDPSLPLSRRWIRASDRFLDVARGGTGLDRELAAFATVRGLDEITARHAELPETLRDLFAPARPAPLVVAVGADGNGRATLLANAAARGGATLIQLRAADLHRDPSRRARQLRALVRECRLLAASPLVEDIDALVDADGTSDQLDDVLGMLSAGCRGPIFATAARARRWPSHRPVIVHDVQRPNEAARAAIWRAALPTASEETISTIAAKYSIGPGAILAAASSATSEAGDEVVTAAHLHRGIRTHVDHQLAGLGKRIEVKQTWNDLIVPEEDLEQIVELTARARQHAKVLDDWGFRDKVGRGVGLCALLSGPPGTGKTMIAGLIANDLGLDLYRIDLSKIVSKYIGETEKQLAAVFDAADAGHAVLLFDEADSLFAKRTAVSSSNDRYANLEVNFLLQRVEDYEGVVLLTSNHESAIDDAFRRRLAMHLRMSLPEEREREKIWRAMIPVRAEVAAAIDFPRLAKDFDMSGGHIKNSVLRAAYVAADREEAIAMGHLWHAARLEYEAMGRLVTHRAAS